MTIITWPPQRRPFCHFGRSGTRPFILFALAFHILFCLQGTSAHVILTDAEADGAEPSLHIARPGQPCKVDHTDSWSEPEKWAWDRICVGEIANFDQLLNQNLRGTQNPDKDCQPSDDRVLSSEFLETILLHEPFRSAIPRRGFRVIGAYFPNEVDLSDARFNSPLWLDDSCFESDVNLHRSSTPEHISFDGSNFAGRVDMESASVELELFLRHAQFDELDLTNARIHHRLDMRGSTFRGDVKMESVSVGLELFLPEAQFEEAVALTNAKIHHRLDMRGSTFRGDVKMESVSVGTDLELSNAEFADVILIHAEIGGELLMMHSSFESLYLIGSSIGGQVNMTNATFESTLDLDSASVGGDLFMRGGAKFEGVDLRGVDISDQLAMSGATFQGDLNMDSASVGGDFYIREDTEFNGQAFLAFLKVEGNLVLQDVKFQSLNLTGAEVNGNLMLGSPEGGIVWQGSHDEQDSGSVPILTLRNTKVGSLQDAKEMWPDQLEMEGFEYQGLGGSPRPGDKSPYNRESAWFINWLAKDRSYSAHPYRHLARLLRNAGYADKAADVLYASRERERQGFTRCQLEWWWLSVLKYTIGYGYGLRFFRALGWVLALALIGWFILWAFGEHTQHIDRNQQPVRLGFWYSLDMVLPVIHLREWHYEDVDLVTGARWCFYFLKIMGLVLVFFVIAGLSGLVK